MSYSHFPKQRNVAIRVLQLAVNLRADIVASKSSLRRTYKYSACAAVYSILWSGYMQGLAVYQAIKVL